MCTLCGWLTVKIARRAPGLAQGMANRRRSSSQVSAGGQEMLGSRKRRLGLLAVAVLAIAIVGAACDPAPPPERYCPQNPPDAITANIMIDVNISRSSAGLNN